MSSTQIHRMLARYSAWADVRLFDALSALPAGVAVAPRMTIFGNMVNTLNHAYVIDLIWKAHLEGVPHGFTSRITQTEPALEALRQAQARVDDGYIAYADHLSADAHDEVVQFDFVGGGAGAMSRGQILVHVANHKTYHRGFVADMICQAGHRPPVMDLTVFLRDAPPDL